MIKDKLIIFWFRRDLRLNDNAGLYRALKSGHKVLPIFIFDTTILSKLEDKEDARVHFIHNEVARLHSELKDLGSSLLVLTGEPKQVFAQLFKDHPEITAVCTNADYEPYARKRDEQITQLCEKQGVSFSSFKDIVIFEKDEVLKDNGEPYTVFTPFRNKWLAKLNDFYLKSYPTEKYFENLVKTTPYEIPGLIELGFKPSSIEFPDRKTSPDVISTYDKTRDFPAVNGTTRLSLHLRFGTVSIRDLSRQAQKLNFTWFSELIWREFYQMILWHFPQSVDTAFKPQYDLVKWRNNEQEFEAWCNGQTGYPIVDAGMRELNNTGFMHNRVRMIVASFLCKHLLIDWRWGEAYFAAKLLDYDMASNVGGWQWAASSGCDAAPYFRVFNPTLQTEKFDKKLEYIRKWIPELDELTYPRPIVDHTLARNRVLAAYKLALNPNP